MNRLVGRCVAIFACLGLAAGVGCPRAAGAPPASEVRVVRAGDVELHYVERGIGVPVVFVHGWKNDCAACNGNLACFRETLALLSAAEHDLTPANERPRDIVGVYVSWRGRSMKIDYANASTKLSIKASSQLIARISHCCLPNSRAPSPCAIGLVGDSSILTRRPRCWHATRNDFLVSPMLKCLCTGQKRLLWVARRSRIFVQVQLLIEYG